MEPVVYVQEKFTKNGCQREPKKLLDFKDV